MQKKIVCYFQGQGHSKGTYEQKITLILYKTVDSLASKLGVMIHHQKPEYLVKKIDYCIQGQGHNKGAMNVCADDIR